MLLSSFITQVETHNFFNLKQEEQKQLLDNALQLESISSYSKIIKESILGYNDIIQNIKSYITVTKNMYVENKSCEELQKKIDSIKYIIFHLNNFKRFSILSKHVLIFAN